MKKLLIISDTHENIDYLKHVLKSEPNNDFIFHLGDNYEDMMNVKSLWKNSILYRVPGIFHPKYFSGELSKIEIVAIENWNFLLVHNIDDIHSVSNRIDFYCFGHTHHREFIKKDSNYFINPGHLKQKFHRNAYASYIVAEIFQDKISIKFYNMDGKVIQTEDVLK